MLFHIAVSDAYAAGFEFTPPTPDRPNDLSRYVLNTGWSSHTPGTYSDDGQMSLAVAECLASGGRMPLDFADAFATAFKRNPRDGYARGFQAFLETVVDGRDFMERIRPESDRNGAAMRSVPIGLLPAVEDVLAISSIQARLTHDTPHGVASARAVALMSHHQTYGLGAKRDLPGFLIENVPGYPWDEPYREKVPVKGVETARAALWTLIDHDDLSSMLRTIVERGGDTDTVAAIVGGVADLSPEIDATIPEALIEGFERSNFGREYLDRAESELRRSLGLALPV